MSVPATLAPVPLALGAALQALALGLQQRADENTSFATRAVGTAMALLLLAAGTAAALAAAGGGPARPLLALLVPLVRADGLVLLVARICRALVWAERLSTAKILYQNEVFPVQAAAMIWNDCQPLAPRSRSEDEDAVVADVLREQMDLWRPTRSDSNLARSVKLPVFVFLNVLCFIVGLVEAAVSWLWRSVFQRGPRNSTPVAVQGAHRQVVGHTVLILDRQLNWIQAFTMYGGDYARNREARRVVVRALHIANLLTHGGYTRLHEHSAGNHAMSEYYSAIRENQLIKSLLSKTDELSVLRALPNGNSLDRGKVIPRQIMWARLVVGSMMGLQGEGRWRGPVASALFTVAQQNIDQWGDSVNRTAIHRHVYSVCRRWLVDWMMFIWWETNIPAEAVNDPDAFFERLQGLLTSNLVHNTSSLPHAVGELAVSNPRVADVETMLSMLLGADWELWMAQTTVASGAELAQAVEESGEWKCFGTEVAEDVVVEPKLYAREPLEDVISTGEDAPIGQQARARLAGRIVAVLTERIKGVWLQLPSRLVDPADTVEPEDEQ